MSTTHKGLLIALATTFVALFQITRLPDLHVGDLFVALLIVGLPLGCCAGALAARVRHDRALTLVGFGLALPTFFGFVSAIARHGVDDLAAHVIGTVPIPICAAMLALERWTRPAAALPIAHRPGRFRGPTNVELAVALSIVAALATFTLIAFSSREHLDEWSRWSHHVPAFGPDRPVSTLIFLVASAVPIGVVLGRIASVFTRFRLPALVVVSGLGATWTGNCMGLLSPLGFRPVYLVSPLLLAILVWRYARPRTDAVPLGAAMIGLLIGAANAIAIAAAVFILILHEEHRWQWEFMVVPCFALLFCAPGGALLGATASLLKTSRHIILHALAFAAISIIALALELPVRREPSALGILLWAYVATAVGVHFLERATRPRTYLG